MVEEKGKEREGNIREEKANEIFRMVQFEAR